MKRRRWWFVGLALALLAACLFGWKWSERPPFAFMDGMAVWYVVADPVHSARCTQMWMTQQSLSVVREASKKELGKPTFDQGPVLTFALPGGMDNLAVVSVPYYRALAQLSPDGDFPQIPVTAKTMIVVVREPAPTALRVEAWLYHLRWNGPKPGAKP